MSNLGIFNPPGHGQYGWTLVLMMVSVRSYIHVRLVTQNKLMNLYNVELGRSLDLHCFCSVFS